MRLTAQGFEGRLDAQGLLDAPAGAADYLGCTILFRGYLSGCGEEFRALIAQAFRRYGGDFAATLNGEFAAAIYDRQARTLLLTHDAFGKVPLFYALRDNALYFSTDLLNLLDPARDRIDEEYIADFLAIGAIVSERTPYRDIKRLLPGQSLSGFSGRTRLSTFWRPDAVEPLRYRDDRDYEERFRAELMDAVSAATNGAPTTWVSLSGGLDSSSIACVAADLKISGLAAYSLTSSERDSDESHWMQPVVERCSIPWHCVNTSDMLPFSELPSDFLGEPTQAVVDEAEIRRRNSELAAHKVSVLLTGHGGDDVLGASSGLVPPHLADALFAFAPLATLRGLRRWQSMSLERRSFAFWASRGVVQPTHNHLSGRRPRGVDSAPQPPWLRRDYAVRMNLRLRSGRQFAPPCRTPGAQVFWDSIWFNAMGLATNSPRGWPFQIRHPLLSKPLVDFMASVPSEQVQQPRCDRYLQRRALKGILPEVVRRRAAKTIGTPLLVRGLARSKVWQDYLCDDPMLAQHGIADREAWRRSVRQASVGQTHGDKQFIAAVAVEVWFKQWRAFRAG